MANNSRQPESFPNEFYAAIFPAPAPAARKTVRACGKESRDPIGAFAR
jgi:hypothetical protein